MGNSGDGTPRDEMPLRSSSGASLTIQLLGSFQVSVGDRRIDPDVWRLRKATHLVKILALTPGHRLHRDQLIDALWPEVDPDSALSSFHQALHAARRALEPGRSARSPQSTLRLHQQVLSLAPDGDLWIDVEAFQEAALRARNAGDLQSCSAALQLYAGELLPEDLYESWTQHPRDSLREMYLELLLTTARLQEATGAASDAIETLRALIATDPLNESAYLALMRLHAASGRRDQAIRLYHQLSETLREELDAEPTDDVTELFRRISSGELIDAAASIQQRLPPMSKPLEMPAHPEMAGGLRLSLAELASERGLFNRHAEVELLQRAFDALLSGRGQIVVLAGEPGIGKTRLTEELTHYAGMSGATVLWGHCHDLEGTPAFWPWFQIVRNVVRVSSTEDLSAALGPGAGSIASVVPDVRAILPDTPVPPELEAEQARFRFFDGMTGFLGRLSERRPLVLIIDDLHWADRSSLMLLEFIAGEIASRRIMLIATYREAGTGSNVPLIRTLERLNRSGAARIELGGLEIQDTADYSEFIAGRPLPENLVQTIYQRTNGNPFFAREVVKLLSDESKQLGLDDPERWSTVVPLGVREAVTLRLSQLSDEARQVLTSASVIGTQFRLDVLAEVSEIQVDRLLDLLEEAVGHGVIAEDPSDPARFVFAHVLTQQTIYDGLIAARRARLHAGVGSALERLYGASADPPYSELAHHFFLASAAGEAERAVTYLTRAAEQSMNRLAYAEAADQFRRAIDILDRYLPDQQAEMIDTLLSLGRAQLAAGEASEARASRVQAVEIARETNDIERLTMIAIEMARGPTGYVDWRAGNEAAVLEEALAALPTDDNPLRVQVMTELALTLFFDKSGSGNGSRQPRLRSLVDDAVAMARRIGAPGLIADTLSAAHDVLWTYEDVEERSDVAREILALSIETNNVQLELTARAMLTGEFLVMGDFDKADRELDTYEAIATANRLPINIWSVTAKRAMRAFIRGQLGESDRLMEQAREMGRRAAPELSSLTYLMQLFCLRREQDRPQEVEEMLSAEAINHPAESFWQCLLAVLYADRGRHDAAQRIVGELVNGGTEVIPRESYWLASLVLLADACATIEDTTHAARLFDILQPHARLFVSPGNNILFLGSVSHYLGRLSATLGRHDDAARYFETAIQAETETRLPVSLAHTRYAYAALLNRQGDRSDLAHRLTDQTLQSAQQYGLIRLLRQAHVTKTEFVACRSP